MERRRSSLLRKSPLKNHSGHLLSTENDGSCILVIVHSVSSDHLIARHNQLLAFRSNGQPVETSHLGDALVELIREKPFDDITVQEILDRAGVGRSTFYTHYTDKQDLFLGEVEAFFEMLSTMLTRKGARAERLAPVTEFFSHLSDVQDFYQSLVASGKANDVWALGRGYFARSIEQRLRLAGVKMDPVEMAAQAFALAGSLFAMLEWWLDHGRKIDPKEMDRLFHTMAWRGLARRSIGDA